jgi:hypothetical protein
MRASTRHAGGGPASGRHPLKRVALATATVLLSVNIWTGAPLLAVWVGSRAVPQSGLSMGAVFLVVVVLAASVIVLVVLLARLSAAYDELTGREQGPRRVAPWLRSMRAERAHLAEGRAGIGVVERILAASVVAAVLVLEVWFFFFAGSSIGNG